MYHICHCSSGKIAYFNRRNFLVYSFFNYAINDEISNYDSRSTWTGRDVLVLKAIRSYSYQ